jgi:site-specific recombinase XerD
MQVLHNSSLRKFKEKLKVQNYSENTINSYVYEVTEFLKLFNKNCNSITNKELVDKLESLQISVSKRSLLINSLKLFSKLILNRKFTFVGTKHPRKPKSLPKVVSHIDMINSIQSINNLKHKSIISLAYSTGIRISELCNLKIGNIDSKRMLILIENGKGRKDRYVPLSDSILSLLRLYFKRYKPILYLFESNAKQKYSKSSCRAIWKKFRKNTQLSFHSIRHSCFTRLLETGTDIRIIQKIAGHSNIKTTEIYTHVSNEMLNKINLPC